MEEKDGIGESRRLAMGAAWHGIAWCTGPRVAVSTGVWQGWWLYFFKRTFSFHGWVDISKMEGLAAALRRTVDGEKVSQLFLPVLMVVTLLHAKQQQLKHSARVPKFMGNQPTEIKRQSKEKAAVDAVCPQLSSINTCGAGSYPHP